jgi:hypothetical protein
VQAELAEYLESAAAVHQRSADLLIANAVLDLVDVPALLPGLLRLLDRDGVYWFTINYDGDTVFAPDHRHDELIMRAYHRDMDERVRYDRPAGESRTGRHLFHHLRAAGAPPLFAGSSDWVVHAAPDGRYPHDEEHFLHCILQTIQDALRDRVESVTLAEWLDARRRQLEAGELFYIAHQLDFLGLAPNRLRSIYPNATTNQATTALLSEGAPQRGATVPEQRLGEVTRADPSLHNQTVPAERLDEQHDRDGGDAQPCGQ